MSRKDMMERIAFPMVAIMGLVSIWIFLELGAHMLPGSNWTTIKDSLVEFFPWLVALIMGATVIVEVIRK